MKLRVLNQFEYAPEKCRTARKVPERRDATLPGLVDTNAEQQQGQADDHDIDLFIHLHQIKRVAEGQGAEEQRYKQQYMEFKKT